MLKGKTVLITGANGGVGISIAELFLKNNANLILIYNKNRNKLDELKKKFPKKKSYIHTYKINLLNSKNLKNTLIKINQKYTVNAFIHCVSLPVVNKRILDNTWNDYQKNNNLQTKSFFEILKFIIPSMKQNKQGKIVTILSSYVIGKPPAGISSYLLGKYSLLGLSKSLAVELGMFNINVNCISPTMTETPLINKLPSKLKEIHVSQVPLGRLASTKDTASVALFLCSNLSNYQSGENILVSGGQTMH
jgi:3-oxoacyl-[acyl-carrier protein] reductase